MFSTDCFHQRFATTRRMLAFACLTLLLLAISVSSQANENPADAAPNASAAFSQSVRQTTAGSQSSSDAAPSLHLASLSDSLHGPIPTSNPEQSAAKGPSHLSPLRTAVRGAESFQAGNDDRMKSDRPLTGTGGESSPIERASYSDTPVWHSPQDICIAALILAVSILALRVRSWC